MRFLNFLNAGLSFVGRAKKFVLVLWLLPAVPALILGGLAAAKMMPALGRSLFADRALGGDALVVLFEFRSSFPDALTPWLSIGVLLMAAATLLLQVVVSAGVVEVALERSAQSPFVIGMRRNFFSFLRTAGLTLIATALAPAVAGLTARGFFKLAEAKGNGTLDLIGVAIAAVLFWLLWAPLDLAADLSRIAAARHDQRSMTRGFFRALRAVLRRPFTFAPLALTFVLLPVLAHALYTALRGSWTPASTAAVLALMVAQQSLMIVRAAMKLGFWGAEVAAYRFLEEPELCRKREKKRKVKPVEDTPPPDMEAASA